MCNHCPSSTTCGTQVSSGVSGKQAPKNLTLWRRIVQFIFLFIMGKWVYYGIFRCPYIVPFVNCESCSMITCWGPHHDVLLCVVDYLADYGRLLWTCFL
ncbi:hypothetical protein [Veillonella rogosae]|uniref:hypothetical protein n=1 Tax=Veillonella rogosae TaxID=423477 RepID=UPI002093D1A5|nr:hypothetical protein [Veillonella rogosae]